MTLQLDLFAEILAEEAIERGAKPETDARAETVDNPLHGHALPAVGTVIAVDRYQGRVQWAKREGDGVRASLKIEPGTYAIVPITCQNGEWVTPSWTAPEKPEKLTAPTALEKPNILFSVSPTPIEDARQALIEKRDAAHRRLLAARGPAIAKMKDDQVAYFAVLRRAEPVGKLTAWPEDNDEARAALTDLAIAQKAIWQYDQARGAA